VASISSYVTSCTSAPNHVVKLYHGRRRTPKKHVRHPHCAPSLATTLRLQAPTLNPAALSSNATGLVDRLLVRNIPRPSHRSVFVGDVVVFNSPLSPTSEQVQYTLVKSRIVSAAHLSVAKLSPDGTSGTR